MGVSTLDSLYTSVKIAHDLISHLDHQFASKIAASQNQNMANSSTGSYQGAPPSGYTGGPPSALRPGSGGYVS